MKKFLIFIFLVFLSTFVKSQDLDKVKSDYLLKKYEDAKTDIDRLDKNTLATYVWQAKIYTALFKSDSLRAKYPDAYKIADEAFGKSLDLKADTSDLKSISIDLYSISFKQGLAAFKQSKWDDALTNFSNSVKYSDIFFPRKWTSLKQDFDTVGILYSGFSAQNAKKPDVATKYYTRLIDNKVSAYNGNTLIDIYKYVLVYFSDNKNGEKFYHYYSIAKEIFDKEDWKPYESDFINKNK